MIRYFKSKITAQIIYQILFFLVLFLGVFGSVGAMEIGNISIMQGRVQLALSMALLPLLAYKGKMFSFQQ